MPKSITFTESPDSLTIRLTPPMKTSIKIGFSIFGFLLIIGSYFIGKIVIAASSHYIFSSLFMLIYGFGVFAIGKSLIKPLFYKEEIEIDLTYLKATVTHIIHKDIFICEVSNITEIYMENQTPSTELPLIDNNKVNYSNLSFGDNQTPLMISSDKGSIIIQTKDNHCIIGNDLPSWDAEEVVEMLNSFIAKTK
jgi:hypothetical protein